MCGCFAGTSTATAHHIILGSGHSIRAIRHNTLSTLAHLHAHKAFPAFHILVDHCLHTRTHTCRLAIRCSSWQASEHPLLTHHSFRAAVPQIERALHDLEISPLRCLSLHPLLQSYLVHPRSPYCASHLFSHCSTDYLPHTSLSHSSLLKPYHILSIHDISLRYKAVPEANNKPLSPSKRYNPASRLHPPLPSLITQTFPLHSLKCNHSIIHHHLRATVSR